MQAEEVRALICAKLKDTEVQVETDGYHYQVLAIGEVFAGLNPVKRQQLIYGCLTQQIMDGTLHAVVIKTFTPDEWQSRS